jgi:transposase
MKPYSKLNFRDQDLYIGLDIHKKNWTVSIFTDHHEHKTFSQDPDPDILYNYLRKTFPGASYHSVYEAGYCGFWIHDELIRRGIDNIVINAADVPTKDKERRRKNNRVDSRKLARTLRAQELEPIYVPRRESLEDRSLLRTRREAVRQQTRIKNQIKGLLSFYGIPIPKQFNNSRWSGTFIHWLKTVTMLRPTGKTVLLYYLDELKHHRKRVAEINRLVKALAMQDRYRDRVMLLITIPGIGIITAMNILTELVTIKRFKNLDKIASFIGLVPGEKSSGDDDDITTTNITSRSHHYLRGMLVESAWVAVRKDPALMMCYHELIKRMNAQRAIIKITKKLLNRIRYVLKNNKPYVIAVVK